MSMILHTEAPEAGIIRNPVVTIGVFDGVHRGHLSVLQILKSKAVALGGESVVITLWPHPRMVIGNPEEKISLLSTQEEKIQLLEKAGTDHLVILPFTAALAEMDATTFISRFLINKIGVKHLVVGFDHHFGRNREGSYERIMDISRKQGFTVEKLDPVYVSGAELSSTQIRGMLENGRLEEANAALGYPYSLSGAVTGGSRLGRTIGFPTANIEVPESWKLIPSTGVYAVEISLDGNQYYGMLNIGYKPTVSEARGKTGLEVHIFDFDLDIYGKNLTLALRKRLRDEQRFSGLEALKNQLIQDEVQCRELFGLMYNRNTKG